jgi:hypothetical protein
MLGTNATMLVHVGMSRALFHALPTGGRAGAQKRLHHRRVRLGLTRQYPGRRAAYVGAIQVQPDAAP